MPIPRASLSTLALLALTGCGEPAEGKTNDAVVVSRQSLDLFAPLPASITIGDTPLVAAQVELGKRLFFETRLSASGSISCNSCHPLDRYGMDGKPVSTGHGGKKGKRNSPTVYNAAGHFAQFWDGRAATVEDQAKGPILNPDEMAMDSSAAVIKVLGAIPDYVEAFATAFQDDDPSLSWDNLAKAIGAFERQLLTPSRWDVFLQGELDALDDREKHGLNTFVSTGCTTCHDKAYVGGRFYRKLGQIKPWPNQDDKGKGALTGKSADDMWFKVPSLRNVAKTAPYFHDGSVASLDLAISMMAEHQLGRVLDQEQVSAIRAWLECLTGEINPAYLPKPK